jgi:hypothetical protein
MDSEEPNPENYRPPAHQMATWLVLGLGVVIVLGLIMVRTEHQPDSSRDYPSRPMIPDAASVLLPPPEMDDEYVPCSDCHLDEPPNPTQREFEEEHDLMEFAHGDLWCLDCHDLNDREQLRLADGALIEYEDSWQLCTQCHGEKLADWRAGVHGKRTGYWRGPKEYRTCVACHNPHTPPFEALEPEPPPVHTGHISLTAGVSVEGDHE